MRDLRGVSVLGGSYRGHWLEYTPARVARTLGLPLWPRCSVYIIVGSRWRSRSAYRCSLARFGVVVGD
jgi:hypothetical protein